MWAKEVFKEGEIGFIYCSPVIYLLLAAIGIILSRANSITPYTKKALIAHLMKAFLLIVFIGEV